MQEDTGPQVKLEPLICAVQRLKNQMQMMQTLLKLEDSHDFISKINKWLNDWT